MFSSLAKMNRFTCLSKLLRQGTAVISDKDQSLISHTLLLRSGILSASSPGVFSLSPVALRAVEKLTTLIDHKMYDLGGQKCQMPVLGRSQLWMESGRWDKFGSELFRVKDRTGRSYCLQPTFEEEVCSFVNSFDLQNTVFPLLVYQISSKFRDEMQPKLGLLRCREFIMKDLDNAKKTYSSVVNVYMDIFRDLGLPIYKVLAHGGLMGDCSSDEFHCPLPVGEDTIYVCDRCNNVTLAANTDSHRCSDCGFNLQPLKSVEIAHCFLLGNTYTSRFRVKTATPNGDRILQMGCYGIGVTRLLAAALEYFTTSLALVNPPTDLRWPVGLAPYSGAIALQKENAWDALSAGELSCILAHFAENPPNSKSTFYASLLPRGDILIDDRPRLSLGRKLVDLKRLGVPWILIAKSGKGDANHKYELVDVHRGCISFAVTLEEAHYAFTHSYFQTENLWKPKTR